MEMGGAVGQHRKFLTHAGSASTVRLGGNVALSGLYKKNVS